MNKKIIIAIIAILIVIIILVPTVIVIKISEPEKIYLNNVFIKTCKENEDTKGPFIYQTFNISSDNKNLNLLYQTVYLQERTNHIT